MSIGRGGVSEPYAPFVLCLALESKLRPGGWVPTGDHHVLGPSEEAPKRLRGRRLLWTGASVISKTDLRYVPIAGLAFTSDATVRYCVGTCGRGRRPLTRGSFGRVGCLQCVLKSGRYVVRRTGLLLSKRPHHRPSLPLPLS
jgi:hypothetical protein